MKSYKIIFFLLIFSNAFSQKKEDVVEIIKPQIICVNSVTSLSGSTRKVIPVHLPPNTIKWFYSFSAFRNKDDLARVSNNFNLLSKLSLLIDQTGSTATAISLLSKPPGTDYCDAYLLNSAKDVTLFENKGDYEGNPFTYVRQGSREGLVSGIVDIDESSHLTDKQYLGLRNQDLNNAVNVLIQVVAVVSVETTSNGWSVSRKQQTYLRLKELINKSSGKQLSAEVIENLTACIMIKLTKGYSPDDISSLAEYEFNPIIRSIGEVCLKEQNLLNPK